MANNLQTRPGFLGKFTVLNGMARELWITFAVKFLGITAYRLTNVTLVLWLSSDLGFSDQNALRLVAAWSLAMTFVALLVGPLTDSLGLRRTFFLGVWICIVARIVMALTTFKWLALVAGLFPLAVGEALGTPVLVAAVRKYSTTNQRSISFSLFYSIMNLGFLAAGYLFDYVRKNLGEYGHLDLPLVGTAVTTYRALFLASLAMEFSLLPVLYFLRKNVEVTDEGIHILAEKSASPYETRLSFARGILVESVKGAIQLFARILRESGFYRLIAFLMLIACLKLIFMQMDYVFPKFGIRELGPGAPVGRLLAINNWLIIFIVPFIGALTQRFAAYPMVILGGLISAASVFIMALPAVWFQPLADGPLGQWLGHAYLGLNGDVHPYYVTTALFLIILSIGEAFYSPRVYEYAAAIAPRGQEASYGALSYVPFLLAKLLVGTFSGTLLAKYCPATGDRHSGTMWLFIALTASIAPLGLMALRKFIRVHEAGREDSAPA